ncbi:lipid II:glycine glycyltransferase FemX [Dehalogenimonas formicexedens]|uniref:lipid II:glycine glycyltransferase FemX n=1 Tax=Dehalogenimonas formicexedens TaxID=1839801 RepID=UPI001314A0F2|nr:GNAT family N-acetyltransferase [Dehalogenimonas formicexedens]
MVDLRLKHLEIRMFPSDEGAFPPGSEFTQDNRYSTYILGLKEPMELWKSLDSGSIRWGIRKAIKDGVKIRSSISKDDLNSFYRLNLATKQRLGVPGHPKAFLAAILNDFGENARLYLAEYNNRIIAGIITIAHGKTVLYAYGAADNAFLIHQPYNLLLWTAIEDASKHGFLQFDFGRVSPSEPGLAAFKRRWGATEKRLVYYYYPSGKGSFSQDQRGLQMASKLWKLIPPQVVGPLSNILFRHIG